MDVHAHVAALAALYGHRKPDAQELIDDLPEVADLLHGKLLALYVAPSTADAERLACALEGLRHHILRLAETIRAEAGADL